MHESIQKYNAAQSASARAICDALADSRRGLSAADFVLVPQPTHPPRAMRSKSSCKSARSPGESTVTSSSDARRALAAPAAPDFVPGRGRVVSAASTASREGLARGVLASPRDGKVSWTAHRDLADATAAILADEGRFEGPTPPLTATQALDLEDFAALATELLGRPVKRELVNDEEFRERLTSQGVPAVRVAITLGLFEASRRGEFASSDSTLERLIGRAPTPVRSLMSE